MKASSTTPSIIGAKNENRGITATSSSVSTTIMDSVRNNSSQFKKNCEGKKFSYFFSSRNETPFAPESTRPTSNIKINSANLQNININKEENFVTVLKIFGIIFGILCNCFFCLIYLFVKRKDIKNLKDFFCIFIRHSEVEVTESQEESVNRAREILEGIAVIEISKTDENQNPNEENNSDDDQGSFHSVVEFS